VFVTFRTPPVLGAPVWSTPLRRNWVESKLSRRSTLRLAIFAPVLTFSAGCCGAATRFRGTDAGSVLELVT
jgi:hypothetical protein